MASRNRILKTEDLTGQHIAQRRKLLWGVPIGLVALQGCGGGSTAVAAPVPAPSPGPTPTPAIASISAWAARPAASSAAGQGIFVPDVGVSGSVWYSNGTAWVPVANPLMLAHRFSNAKMDGSVGSNADVLLDSCTIPAYVLGPMSGLRITAAFSFPGTGTANKAPQVRAWFGVGTYASSSTPLLDSQGQFFTQKSFLLYVTLQNRNSMSQNQIRPTDYNIGPSSNAFSNATIDFSQDVNIGFGGFNNSNTASADDQQVLDWFSIELLA